MAPMLDWMKIIIPTAINRVGLLIMAPFRNIYLNAIIAADRMLP